MLLKGYRKEIFRPKCNPGFESVHCIAHLDQDIGESLPYLNAELGGFELFQGPAGRDLPGPGQDHHGPPPADCGQCVKGRCRGRQDPCSGSSGRSTTSGDRREEIQPSYHGAPKPKILEILKLLPKTNCRKCGQPTCMVFASLVAQGVKGPEDCPELNGQKSEELKSLHGQAFPWRPDWSPNAVNNKLGHGMRRRFSWLKSFATAFGYTNIDITS